MQRYHVSKLHDDVFTESFISCRNLRDSRNYRSSFENRVECILETCALHGVDLIRVVVTPLRMEKCLSEEYEDPYVEDFR